MSDIEKNQKAMEPKSNEGAKKFSLKTNKAKIIQSILMIAAGAGVGLLIGLAQGNEDSGLPASAATEEPSASTDQATEKPTTEEDPSYFTTSEGYVVFRDELDNWNVITSFEDCEAWVMPVAVVDGNEQCSAPGDSVFTRKKVDVDIENVVEDVEPQPNPVEILRSGYFNYLFTKDENNEFTTWFEEAPMDDAEYYGIEIKFTNVSDKNTLYEPNAFTVETPEGALITSYYYDSRTAPPEGFTMLEEITLAPEGSSTQLFLFKVDEQPVAVTGNGVRVELKSN